MKQLNMGGSRRCDWGHRNLLKPTKVALFHHDFVQFRKQHIKTIFPQVVCHVRNVLLFAI